MNKNNKLRWITNTAIVLALLVVAQATLSPLSQLVAGSATNLLLIVGVMVCGLASGLTVAVISPLIAKLVGIGPFWALIPFIALGNITLVLLWHFIGNAGKRENRVYNKNSGSEKLKTYRAYVFALVAAAVAKCLVLYVGVVKIAVPVILALPEKQAAVVSGMFALPQLFTALIGGALATAILPALKKAFASRL